VACPAIVDNVNIGAVECRLQTFELIYGQTY
jgi:hypothetical protein